MKKFVLLDRKIDILIPGLPKENNDKRIEQKIYYISIVDQIGLEAFKG